ncbi:hypothetical protein ACUW6W_000919 [Micrococcus sp. 093350064-1]
MQALAGLDLTWTRPRNDAITRPWSARWRPRGTGRGARRRGRAGSAPEHPSGPGDGGGVRAGLRAGPPGGSSAGRLPVGDRRLGARRPEFAARALPRRPRGRGAGGAAGGSPRSGRNPADPTANRYGIWWSIPVAIVASVSQVPAGLDLIGDDSGAGTAAVTPWNDVGRTYKVTSPGDRARLWRSVPLDVSASRRHDWHRVTGDRVAGDREGGSMVAPGSETWSPGVGCAPPDGTRLPRLRRALPARRLGRRDRARRVEPGHDAVADRRRPTRACTRAGVAPGPRRRRVGLASRCAGRRFQGRRTAGSAWPGRRLRTRSLPYPERKHRRRLPFPGRKCPDTEDAKGRESGQRKAPHTERCAGPSASERIRGQPSIFGLCELGSAPSSWWPPSSWPCWPWVRASTSSSRETGATRSW